MTNTMQLATDKFDFRRQTLLTTTQPIDTAGATSIIGFEVEGTQPDGTQRRIIFEIENKLYKFKAGQITEFNFEPSFVNVLANGNTVQEVLEMKNLSDWVGKKIYPIIALDAPSSSPVMPSIKIGLKVNSFNDIYTKVELSPIYNLRVDGKNAKLINCTVEKILNGHAALNIRARIGNDGDFSDWLDLYELPNKRAQRVQFRAEHILTTLDGQDSSRVGEVKLDYSTDADKSAYVVSELVTEVQEYDADLSTCYFLVEHSRLRNSEIRAYVAYLADSDEIKNLEIGEGTGEEATYRLGHSSIDQDFLEVQCGGVNIPNVYYDTDRGTVTLTAPAGEKIFASFKKNLYADAWWEMEKDFTKLDGNHYVTRFIYKLDQGTSSHRVVAKIQIRRHTGKVENLRLGVGTAAVQNFVLNHKAKEESLTCTGSYKYDEDSQILSVIAPYDEEILVSYDWLGECPSIFSYICGLK